MRIVEVAHYYPPHVGGIENVVHQTAARLAESGDQVSVVSCAEPELPGTREENGVRVHRVRSWTPFAAIGVPFPFLDPVSTARAFSRVGKADVVHVHDLLYPTTWIAVLWAVVQGIPVVLTQHVAVVDHPAPIVRLIQRFVYASVGRVIIGRCAAVLYLNGDVAKMLDRLGANAKKRFLPNAVDTDFFRPAHDAAESRSIRQRFDLPLDKVLAVFVGRFVPKKGFDLLRAAIPDGVTAVFIGGPAPEDAIATDPSTVWAGVRSRADTAEIMRACDIFVLPSTGEGFPLTVQEAMASGLPIVTTDEPGYQVYDLDRDMVKLVAREKEPIRTAIANLAACPGIRLQMAAYSRRQVDEHFGWDAHLSDLRDVFREIRTR